MSGADLSRLLTAAGTVLVALLIVFLVDRAFKRRGRRLADRVTGGEGLDPTLETRLRFVRRLVQAVIVVIGVATALSQFTALDRFAASVLASGAIAAAVVGFAAQQSLGNVIAGVLLAVTQPIRIGDLITFEEETGTVEDVRLTYTYVRTEDGRRIIIPNERLAQNTVENHTIVDPRVHVEVSVWIAPEVDALEALAALRDHHDDVDVSIAEIDKDGVRLVAGTWARNSGEREPVAAGLRASCLERLPSAGLS